MGVAALAPAMGPRPIRLSVAFANKVVQSQGGWERWGTPSGGWCAGLYGILSGGQVCPPLGRLNPSVNAYGAKPLAGARGILALLSLFKRAAGPPEKL